MNSENINIETIVQHWIKTSDEDFGAMLELFNAKSFSWSLFIGHITIEKLLKAYYVSKNQKHAPFTHNLFRLAELSDLDLPIEYADYLDTITTFNLNARYDDYKREFYSLCTLEYSSLWIENIKTIRLWIKAKL